MWFFFYRSRGLLPDGLLLTIDSRSMLLGRAMRNCAL